MGVVSAVGEALAGLKSMVVGLRVTGTNFFRPRETVHYPRQEVPRDALESFRGHIELVGSDEDPSRSRCVGCGLCEEACPTLAIQLTPDFEMSTDDPLKLVFEKRQLLIDGGGKDNEYDFYRHAGVAVGREPGTHPDEEGPVNPKSNFP